MRTFCSTCQNGPFSLRLAHSKWLATRSASSCIRAAEPWKQSGYIHRPCAGRIDERDVVEQARRLEVLGVDLPNQGQSAVKGTDPEARSSTKEEKQKPPSDLDYLGVL